MGESYTYTFEWNEKTSKKSQERLGELFFDWWKEIWCKRSTSTAELYSSDFSIEDLLKELDQKFPFRVIVDKIEKPLSPLKECMTDEWTSLTWDHKLHAYFKTEEDKVKFILFST